MFVHCCTVFVSRNAIMRQVCREEIRMAQFHHYNYIFEPIKIGNMTVKNRLQFSPLVCSLSGTNGGVTREYLEFIKMQAATGVGVVNIGATSIDHDTGTDYV